jgi:cytochrome P450
MSLFTDFDHLNPPLGPDGTPYEYWESVRDESIETDTAIGWSEQHGGYWITAGWDASREIHHNTASFSNTESTFPKYGTPSGEPLMLAEMDDPTHKKYRKVVQAPFSPKNAEYRNDQVRGAANRLIDKVIDAGRADMCEVTDYLPERVTAIILGLPEEDGAKYRRWVHAMVQSATDPEGAAPDLAEMKEYWNSSVDERRLRRTGDLLTEIVHAEADGVRLNNTELLDLFSILLLGGIDNTSRLLATMFWRLGWDKELRRRLARDPGLIPFAVEEFLRLDGPAMVFRLVTEPVTVAGVNMEPGQIVALAHPVSNRDPRQFPNPDAFVADRSPNRHFALGLGIHRCLGLHLVKVEARIMLEEWVKRVPEFELDPERKPVWKAGQVGAMIEVPIVFPPGGGLNEDWRPASALVASPA